MKYRLGDLTVKHWNDWDRVPRDPVSAAIAVAVTGATTGFAYYAVYAISTIAISAVTSWALSALAPKPDFSSFSSFGSQGTLVNAREAAAAADFVYGEVRKGGTVVFYESTGAENKYLHQVIALAGHEVNDIGDIYINDEVVSWNASTGLVSGVWGRRIRIRKHLGDQTTADAELVRETSAGATFVGNGIAYLYVRYQYDQDVFANGLPLVTAKVQGKKVYDPRTDTTAYSNNAALCMRDFLVSEYGLNDSAIDDVSFSVAANESDEDVTLAAGGTEKRYTINGIVKSSSPIGKVLGDMSTACAGTLFWGSGYWKLKVGAYSSPVKTLTLDDLRGPISMKTRTSMRDSFNGVSGTFNDAEQDFITADYPPIQSDIFKAEDGGDELMLDLPLPFTTSAATAQRIAKLTLYRAREQISISADFGLNAFDIEVGDIIAFDNERYGFDGKEFEVMGWRFESNQNAGDLRVKLTLQETSEAAFDWNAEETAIIANNTTLPDFRFAPPLRLVSVGSNILSNQQIINVINVTTAADAASEVSHVEVEFKRIQDIEYLSVADTSLGVTTIRGVNSGEKYTIRARAVNVVGVRGDWSYDEVEVSPYSSQDTLITNISVDLGLEGLVIGWNPIIDPSLSHVEIRHSVSEDGTAAWADATTDTQKVARPSTEALMPSRSGTFMLRPVSKTGSVGAQQADVIVQASDLPSQFSNSTTVSEQPTFSGGKENLVITSSELRMDQASIMLDVIEDPFIDQWGTDFPDQVLFAFGWIYFPDVLGGSVICDKTNVTAYSFFQDITDSAGTWELRYSVLYGLPRGSEGDYPPDGYFTVSMGDSGEIPLPMSPGEHIIQISTTTTSGRITFSRDLNVKAQLEFSSPSKVEMSGFSLVKKPNVYTHDNDIDVGSVKQVRLTKEVETVRYAIGGDLWDSMTGPWDTWAGYFDEWTGDDRPSDTDVDVYFSRSDDNTNWSDWVKFRSTNSVGRYFRFKSELKSDRQAQVSPSISKLQIKAEYE